MPHFTYTVTFLSYASSSTPHLCQWVGGRSFELASFEACELVPIEMLLHVLIIWHLRTFKGAPVIKASYTLNHPLPHLHQEWGNISSFHPSCWKEIHLRAVWQTINFISTLIFNSSALLSLNTLHSISGSICSSVNVCYWNTFNTWTTRGANIWDQTLVTRGLIVIRKTNAQQMAPVNQSLFIQSWLKLCFWLIGHRRQANASFVITGAQTFAGEEQNTLQ